MPLGIGSIDAMTSALRERVGRRPKAAPEEGPEPVDEAAQPGFFDAVFARQAEAPYVPGPRRGR